MDIDEDWVKLSCDTINQQRETKLVRIEDMFKIFNYKGAKAMILKIDWKSEGAWWTQPIRTSQASRVSRQSISLLSGEYTPSVIIAITIAQIFKEPVRMLLVSRGEE